MFKKIGWFALGGQINLYLLYINQIETAIFILGLHKNMPPFLRQPKVPNIPAQFWDGSGQKVWPAFRPIYKPV